MFARFQVYELPCTNNALKVFSIINYYTSSKQRRYFQVSQKERSLAKVTMSDVWSITRQLQRAVTLNKVVDALSRMSKIEA